MSSVVKRKFSVNKNRLRILGLLYKFRYITIPLLQEYLGLKHPSTIWRTLQSLEEENYVANIYEKSYIKLSKPAHYFLDKKSLNYLKDQDGFNHSILHTYYKNKGITEETRQHYLDTFAAYNALRHSYNDSYYMFTKSELVSFDEFPENKPDLYLRHINNQGEYFITLAHDIQPFLTRKRMAEYIEHSEDDGWPTGEYPGLLFVLKNNAHETQFLSYAEKVLDSAGITNDELPIAVTTIKALTQKPYTASIWTFLGDKTPSSLDE